MDKYLTNNQIDYILFHLNLVIDVSAELRECFLFSRSEGNGKNTGTIVFPLSKEALAADNIIVRNDIPVLFPISESEDHYHIEDGNLYFHHDLLKSAFYLLSGYQELDPDHLDQMGRYPYSLSLQSRLDMTGKPIVNYYFQVIAGGIEEFCKIKQIPFKRKKSFENFCFFLTHDVDRVDTYTIYEVIYRFKQTLGLAKPFFGRAKSLRIALHFLLNYLNIFGRKNPQWDFPFLREEERKHGFHSAFYFLPKDQMHQDAYYTFGERRIKKLFEYLNREECEIGLHGTVRSHCSLHHMKENYDLLKTHSPQEIHGIRQHRLMYDIKITPNNSDELGFMYDTSLGFAEHVGFRNSFCLPFKLYDHANDQMLDTWEIPLVAMDASIFAYQKYSMEQAHKALEDLIDEAGKFNGIFTLLWHNGYFDEQLFPGITQFYRDLLAGIKVKQPENMLGHEIIERITKSFE